jgi:hypothetical protein
MPNCILADLLFHVMPASILEINQMDKPDFNSSCSGNGTFSHDGFYGYCFKPDTEFEGREKARCAENTSTFDSVHGKHQIKRLVDIYKVGYFNYLI